MNESGSKLNSPRIFFYKHLISGESERSQNPEEAVRKIQREEMQKAHVFADAQFRVTDWLDDLVPYFESNGANVKKEVQIIPQGGNPGSYKETTVRWDNNNTKGIPTSFTVLGSSKLTPFLCIIRPSYFLCCAHEYIYAIRPTKTRQGYIIRFHLSLEKHSSVSRHRCETCFYHPTAWSHLWLASR